MWKKYIPATEWLRGYNSTLLKGDAVAGVTLAAYGIPASLADATIAGLPPQYGVYGYLLGGLFYSMLGTGRQLAIGPTAAISLLIGSTVSDMANGDVQRWADIASLATLIFAAMAMIAYLLRLSGIINFISDTVLVGFKAGAALTIILTQLPKLFGVAGSEGSFFERLTALIHNLPGTNLAVLLFGIAVIVLLFFSEKLLPGLPIAIIVIIISILLISYTTVGSLGFKTIGIIPPGLPSIHLPTLRIKDVEGVIPLAFACFLLSYIESVSVAKTIAQKNGYEIDIRQELLALSVANAAVALGRSFPVAGGMSQTAVNDNAGAKTPMSIVFASLTIALCLLFLTGTLQHLPTVVLAGIVIVAVMGMLDIKAFRYLYKVDKNEFAVAVTALAGVVGFGILNGVLLGAVVTIVLLIKNISTPTVAFLGRIPGTKRYTDIARHPDNENIPGVLIVRIEASILYFNTEFIRNQIWAKLSADSSSIKTVILDLNSSPRVDMEGTKFLKRLFMDLKAKGISLKIAEARSEVRDKLRVQKLEELFGPITRFMSVDDLVEDAVKE